MLPELLFGGRNSSMQDLSREELNLLHNGCDKDLILANGDATLERLKLCRTPEPESTSVPIKLEENCDSYLWQTTNADIGSNLLHSEDPLISGAIDDNHNEFDTIANCKPLSISSPTNCTSNKKPSRTRKKGQVKLHFHHQALPQEYLDHYEATQNHLIGRDLGMDSIREKNKSYDDIDLIQDKKIHDSMQLWLQKVTEIHDDKVTEEQKLTKEKLDGSVNVVATKKPSRIPSYNDLPYMGEMTLENSKPRRGRKPKKADICHLIYKNYGTVFPDQPVKSLDTNDDECTPEMRRTNIQNKLISSLLEKRLTQKEGNIKNNGGCKTIRKSETKPKTKSDEPLNLCIRDIYNADIEVIPTEDAGDCIMDKTEFSPLILPNDVSLNSLFSPNLKMALPNFQSALLGTEMASQETTDISDGLESSSNWLSSNAFMHPMALYLHKMADASPYSQTNAKPKNEALAALTNVLVPKTTSELVKEGTCIASTGFSSALSNSTNAKASNTLLKVAPKRKRSAIFIPPVPEESSTNHATEVSICKFKFTGGAKPSLQEKKMLSVDAGGNFRYYSGTGDKSIRGYEFFPRESLQQSSLIAGSSAGAFLNTAGKRIPTDLQSMSHGFNNESVHSPMDIITAPQSPMGQCMTQHSVLAVNDKYRKRMSKRSVQREKLEKTFKEQGFLIQTQQLQSAEGATYCKFRQLRKFTRYLFRSWKDYLPGELRQGGPLVLGSNIDSVANDSSMRSEQQLTTLCSHSSPKNNEEK